MLLLVGRKYINDTVNGICSADRVKRGQKQMPRLSGSHSNIDGFIVPHFAEENDIRALTQSGAQGGDIVLGIYIYLTLADNTLIMAVKILHGIFQCDDVTPLIFVYLVYHTGQSCGFSASCRPCDKNHTLSAVTQMHDIFGQAER